MKIELGKKYRLTHFSGYVDQEEINHLKECVFIIFEEVLEDSACFSTYDYCGEILETHRCWFDGKNKFKIEFKEMLPVILDKILQD